jgi:Biotin carboxylase, N-terminal domain/Carbamoyl-phosphate synthase L chain, ATP binding domain
VLETVPIANRGEVAVRVIRARGGARDRVGRRLREPDRSAPHVGLADEAHLIGAGPPRESYLDGGTIVEGALRSGCDAVHPGYGFLPENAAFAQACADAGLAFVGPGPEAIEAIGSKTRAREIVAGLGPPVVPGSGAVASARQARQEAERIGYRVAVKAAGGGGALLRRPRGLPGAPLRGSAPRRGAAARRRRRRGGPAWASATAPSSAVTRSSSRTPRPPPSGPRCARGWERWPFGSPAAPATARRAPSRGCWWATTSSSSR